MLSLLYKGVQLEATFGTLGFTALAAGLTVLSHGLLAGASVWAAAAGWGSQWYWYA